LLECTRGGFVAHTEGAESGRIDHELRREHKALAKPYESLRLDIVALEAQIDADQTLNRAQITEIRRDIRRLDDPLVDIRAF